MRILGFTETCDLGALYRSLIAEGHEVRIIISEAEARGTMRGLVTQIEDWDAALEWVGHDGLILFESVSEGYGERQDALRLQGYRVIGGSAWGDRLENDRAFGQELLAELGFPAGHVWEFAEVAEGIDFIGKRPARYVIKFSGPDFSSGDNFIGEMTDGADVAAYLSCKSGLLDGGSRYVLMEFIEGIEMGVGAYFNGERFLRPACLDWEHKRFFAGDMGELTGEMGTVATFTGSDVFFEATLLGLEPYFRGRGHIGYVNLNTIVNDAGIWPLEFTCRFGYPGFAVLDPLQETPWGDLFERMLDPGSAAMEIAPGFSTGIVVTTPPFPYSRKQMDEPIGLPILLSPSLTPEDHDHLHYGEVGLAGDQLITSGLYGWTMVVTGTGASINGSIQAAYDRVAKIHVPRGRYRLDIGDRIADEYERLETLGWIGPGAGFS
ncbi:MAG: phosphoribosylamine--glycine ligase [Sphingosinicella sp.]|nr:phosphoribosylamine--glycine ligase [Sphingosinicella sp.]